MAWSKPESPRAQRQGRVHSWEGDLGERAGACSPTLREPAWAQRGLAHPAGPTLGRGRRVWGTDSTSMQEWRAGLQRGPREPVLGGRGEVTVGPAQIWREALGLEEWVPQRLRAVGSGGGHRGCRPGTGGWGGGSGGPVPTERSQQCAGCQRRWETGTQWPPASCCFPGPGEMDRPSRSIVTGKQTPAGV